jgi:hypothetical protein
VSTVRCLCSGSSPWFGSAWQTGDGGTRISDDRGGRVGLPPSATHGERGAAAGSAAVRRLGHASRPLSASASLQKLARPRAGTLKSGPAGTNGIRHRTGCGPGSNGPAKPWSLSWPRRIPAHGRRQSRSDRTRPRLQMIAPEVLADPDALQRNPIPPSNPPPEPAQTV